MIKRNWILISIILIASALRFIGVSPGYNRYHNDEPIIYGTAIEMVENKTLDPGRFDYPGGPIYVNYLAFKFVFIPERWAFYYISHIPQIVDGTVHVPISPLEKDRLFNTYVLGGRDFYPLFWGRYVVALFGVGNVFLLYILGKLLFNKKVGLIAALLIAVNFRQVLNSHLDLPDIYNAFFLLLTFIASVYVWKKPSGKYYLFAGIAFGLSLSMKYQVFGMLPIALAHLYNSTQSKSFWKSLFNLNLVYTGSAALLIFAFLNPYFFIHFELARFWLESVSVRYGAGANTLTLYPISYLYHYDYGAIESIFILFGVILTTLKFFKKSILLLSVVIPFMATLLYLSRGGFYVRNFVTITPVFLLFAAILIAAIYDFLFKKVGFIKSAIFIFIVVGLTILVPAKNSVANTYFYTKPWGYQVLSDWLFKNKLENAKGKNLPVVAANPFDPPTGAPPIEKTEFELSGSYSLAEHKDDGANYALSNSDWTANPLFFWMSYGVSDLRKFWNKPIDILRNTFYGLAIEEHFRYQIFSTFKSWQAPDESLVLAKIPVWPEVQFSALSHFNFNKDMEGWNVFWKEDASSANYIFDGEMGKQTPGSIEYLPFGSKYSVVRITSKPIDVKPGYLYKVSGFVKSEQALTSRSRNGFMRIDFYSDSDFRKVGIISSISSRDYGTNDWVEKIITERAPIDAKYMTISFQMSDNTTSKFWLDDVNVEVSKDKVEDIITKAPYDSSKKIDLDLLYTNSHANL